MDPFDIDKIDDEDFEQGGIHLRLNRLIEKQTKRYESYIRNGNHGEAQQLLQIIWQLKQLRLPETGQDTSKLAEDWQQAPDQKLEPNKVAPNLPALESWLIDELEEDLEPEIKTESVVPTASASAGRTKAQTKLATLLSSALTPDPSTIPPPMHDPSMPELLKNFPPPAQPNSISPLLLSKNDLPPLSTVVNPPPSALSPLINALDDIGQDEFDIEDDIQEEAEPELEPEPEPEPKPEPKPEPEQKPVQMPMLKSGSEPEPQDNFLITGQFKEAKASDIVVPKKIEPKDFLEEADDRINYDDSELCQEMMTSEHHKIISATEERKIAWEDEEEDIVPKTQTRRKPKTYLKEKVKIKPAKVADDEDQDDEEMVLDSFQPKRNFVLNQKLFMIGGPAALVLFAVLGFLAFNAFSKPNFDSLEKLGEQNARPAFEMERLYLQAVQSSPNDPRGWSGLSYWQSRQEGKALKSLESQAKAIKLAPKNAKNWYSLALLLKTYSNYKESLRAVNEAIALEPSNNQYLSLQSQVQNSD